MSENAVCTIVTKSHLAYAKTLMESVTEHNSHIDCYILLADTPDEAIETKTDRLNWIFIEDLQDKDLIDQCCFYYNAFEFCNALRGFLHEYLLNKTIHDKWIYLDSDILVLSSLDPIFKQLEGCNILLNPHSNEPFPVELIEEYELSSIRGGVYNSGFLGLKRSPETQRFVQWFKERLISYSFDDLSKMNPRGLFVDQLWLNLVPVYFNGVELITHPGANLAHWNLFKRALSRGEAGEYYADGLPLIFAHFSGWDIEDIYQVSKHSTIYGEDPPEIWIKLSEEYKRRLVKNGHENTKSLAYSFSTFENGQEITLSMREFYYSLVTYGTWKWGNPFKNYRFFEDSCSQKFSKKINRKIRKFPKYFLGMFDA